MARGPHGRGQLPCAGCDETGSAPRALAHVHARIGRSVRAPAADCHGAHATEARPSIRGWALRIPALNGLELRPGGSEGWRKHDARPETHGASGAAGTTPLPARQSERMRILCRAGTCARAPGPSHALHRERTHGRTSTHTAQAGKTAPRQPPPLKAFPAQELLAAAGCGELAAAFREEGFQTAADLARPEQDPRPALCGVHS